MDEEVGVDANEPWSLIKFYVFNGTCNIVVVKRAGIMLWGHEVLRFVNSRLILLVCSRICGNLEILTV